MPDSADSASNAAPPASAESLLLFVYGSLKRGEHNQHHLGPDAAFLGAARTVPGYRLFNLGTYPGMIPWPADGDGVLGEVWSLPIARLPYLDAFEGVPEQLYQRAPIQLLPPFADRPVATYLYARRVEGCAELGAVWTGRPG